MSSKKTKPHKLKARLPRGFADRGAAEIRATEAMVAKIRDVFERYGFDPVDTPMFEYTDALGKFLPDQDRPGEGVFSLTDDDEQWMSLRYDLTAPLARHVAENINEIALPYRTYRAGWVFRNEKPGPGRFRQFMQFDADTVGAPGVQADAEMAMLMADTMEALGIARGDYVIRVNNRKVLDGVMEAIGLGGEENAGRRLTVLRAIDKLDRLGIEGVRQLLGEGRWDGGKEGEGDFTPGAGLDEEQIERLEKLFGAYTENHTDFFSQEHAQRQALDDDDVVFSEHGSKLILAHPDFLASYKEFFSDSPLAVQGFNELEEISNLVRAGGYGTKRVRANVAVVRGLEYYTGPVYEAELLFEVPNEKGEIVRFGSVAGGGRYDGLVKRFTGRDVPATGFSIGVSRLLTALKNLGKLEDHDLAAPVLVTVMDGDTDALGRYQKFTQDLRAAGIRAEMYQGNWKKFGNQLRYADRRGCPIAVIQGSDERAAGKIQLKDMIEGRRQAAAIESNVEWRALRPGQVEVDEADLVDQVKKLLVAQAAEGGD